MKTLMIIETTHGGLFYSLTYLGAILAAAAIVTYSGFRKGYPKIAWLLILMAGGLFFITGEKVFTYTMDLWNTVFTKFVLPPTSRKTILGGIIGLFTGLIIAKVLLKFRLPVFDHFAIALPVAMAISRIGCHLAGCCYGTPTQLPWGIRYDSFAPAYYDHLSHGLIDVHNPVSLAVHPVQLYQVIGCMLIALFVWKMRKLLKSNGNLFLLSVLSYAVLRFFIEFVRDPDSSFVMVKIVYGLKILQWVLLAVIVSGTLIIFHRELKAKKINVDTSGFKARDLNVFLLASILWVIIIAGRKWFTKLELMTILLFFIPFSIALIVRIYQKYTVSGFRWAAPLVMLGGCMLMSQTMESEGKHSDKVTFTEIGLTGMIGKYFENVSTVFYSEDPCTGGHKYFSSLGDQKRNFYQGGFGISYNSWHGKYYKFRIGGSLFMGDESGGMHVDSPSGSCLGIKTNMNFDWHWFGFGTGIAFGQMKIPGLISPNDYKVGDIVSTEYRQSHFVPTLSARVGPYDIFYAEGNIFSQSVLFAPFPSYFFGVGTGLGKTNGTKIGLGYCFDGLYAELNYPYKDKLIFKAFYADSFGSAVDSYRAFSLGLNYKFNSKNTNPKK